MTEHADRLDGERVYLRRVTPDDLDERFLAWFQDHDLVQYYSSGGRDFSRASMLAEIEAGEASGTAYLFCICLQDSDRCIGTIRLGPIVPAHKISDLVVLIGERQEHGKGLAAEAISLGNRAAFEWHDLRKLYGGMYEANVAAVRAYVNGGWVVEGRLEGHYWVDGQPMDRILVGCFNPRYFPDHA